MTCADRYLKLCASVMVLLLKAQEMCAAEPMQLHRLQDTGFSHQTKPQAVKLRTRSGALQGYIRRPILFSLITSDCNKHITQMASRNQLVTFGIWRFEGLIYLTCLITSPKHIPAPFFEDFYRIEKTTILMKTHKPHIINEHWLKKTF